MTQKSKQDFLSVTEFARLIKVSALSVRRWDNEKKQGKPKAKKVSSNGHRLYTLEQVAQYLKKKQITASTKTPAKKLTTTKKLKAVDATGAVKSPASKKRNVTKNRR